VRLALLISLVVFGGMVSAVRADDSFAKVIFEDSTEGYIVSRDYAEDHKAELTDTIPGPVKIDGFWTPTEQDVDVAERVLRDLLDDAMKDPATLFPDLATSKNPDDLKDFKQERNELVLVAQNYNRYVRQYVGVIIEKQKLVFCNYSYGTKVDPSADYIFIDQVFAPDGAIRFLQCRFEPKGKVCSNVSLIGSWQPPPK
jgi:hypothetical protein